MQSPYTANIRFRKGFQSRLPEIFSDLRDYHKSIDSRMKAESFKQRVMNCFKAWEDWALYPQMQLIRYQNIFLGLVADDDASNGSKKNAAAADDDDVDGNSMSDDDDVDGIPLDGAALLKASKSKSKHCTRMYFKSLFIISFALAGKGQPDASNRLYPDNDYDVDGTPMKPSMQSSAAASKGTSSSSSATPGFVPSKWETVAPEEVQAQAVTSKWDIFDGAGGKNPKGITEPDDEEDDEDIDGVPLGGGVDGDLGDGQVDLRVSEDRRARLREIEIEVVKYQDELESGKQAVKPGWTISEQVCNH